LGPNKRNGKWAAEKGKEREREIGPAGKTQAGGPMNTHTYVTHAVF